MRSSRLARPSCLLVTPVLLALSACGDSDSDGAPALEPTPTPAIVEPTPAPTQPPPMAPACAEAAFESMRACVRMLNRETRACYLAEGTGCDVEAGPAADVLADVESAVLLGCAGPAQVAEAGFGDAFTPETLAARVQSMCRAEVASLAARSFGGPHAAVLADADSAARDCLEAAHFAGEELMDIVVGARSICLAQEEAEPGGCSVANMEATIETAADGARTAIEASCEDLAALVALSPETFVERALDQTDCLTAATHGRTAPLALECGPRDVVPPAPRGEYIQVVLEEDVWGTRCGDGSPFAFWVRLAPEGSPVENVVVGMQGGGVCVFEGDCANRNPGLFEALDDTPPVSGPLSNDPAVNPLADYTKVFLPYCNQDVFIGGGATSNFDAITVHRFGALNVRAALRWVRDAIWRELDETTAGGYTPQRMRVYFGGFSAGAFGTLYNYHYVLDDLQWERTAAFPDGGLALDSATGGLSVAALGALVVSDAQPVGWGAREELPPYCFETDCGLGPRILETSAPRLLGVPEQQFMILSNQNDRTQVGTTFFPSTPDWINAMRQSYCDTKDIPGVNYFLTPIASSVHVVSPRPELYADFPVDGQEMRDWLAQVMLDPMGVQDRVEEGDLVDEIEGVEPFPCEVAP